MGEQTASQSYTSTQTHERQIRQYNVFLINDDYTTFEFVISILIKVFRKSESEAEKITMNVHRNGKGLAGTYTREIALMKVKLVRSMAESAGYPLQAEIEEQT